MGDLLKQIERWNDHDEFSRCIEAIEAIPESERGYKLTVLLGRAYSNLAVLGDHGSNADDDEVDQEMLSHAIEILRGIEDQGKDDPLWNARMANACWMVDGMEATALQYAQRWLELEPDSENAQKLVSDCIAHTEQEEQDEESSAFEMYDTADWDAVEEHIGRYFGEYEHVMHEMVSPDIHLDICLIPPRKDHNYYTLVTMGMGAHKMVVPEGLSDKKLERAELLINLPPDWLLSEDAWKDEEWYWPIGVLKWCARYPVNNPDTWLGWGHTVTSGEDGEPFAKSTKLCGVMLLNPGVFGEPSFFCSLPGGDDVNFYQLIPLYKEEMDFKIENSVEELLSKFPDELLEVIDPSRPNAITDEEAIGYDEALMDDAENSVAVIREKQLPVEELAAYNHLAIYLRWCMEHDQMSNPFLAKHQDVVEAVKAGNGPDLRVFLRDSEDLQGKLSLIYFNREGAEFAGWYSWGSRATPYSYAKDIDAHARAYFGDERYESAEFQDEAYLFVPWNEQCYQEIAKVIDGRFAEWKALDENQEPEKDLAIKPGELKELLQGWDGPRDCFATDRIVVDGCRIGSCYREVADRTDQGWDSGWRFLSGDEDDEYMGMDEHFGIYDLNTLCNFDPDIIPLLSMPAGTWLERGEDGTFQEAEDDEEEEE